MSGVDGDLSEVNPGLLALCQNSEAWKEQRKAAIRAKILGQPQGTQGSTAGQQQERSATVSDSRAEFVLQQIKSRKHGRHEDDSGRHENGGAPPPPPPPPPSSTNQETGTSASETSLKQKLLDKFRKQSQPQ
jgi:hypothetical protein